MFVVGLVIFTVASAACGVAQSQAMLVVARFVQGAGGALTSAVILGVIVTMFPEPREQAKAIGVFSFVASAGASIGLLGGGVLTQALNWHWIFFVNLPIGVVTVLLARRLVADDSGIGLRSGADAPGALLITGALMLAVYAIVQTSEHGWGSASTIALGAATLGLLVAFVVREARARTPLVPLGIFRSRVVTGANLVQMLMVARLFGMFFLGAVYFQRVLGYGPLQVGLAFLPVAVSIGIFSLVVAPRLIVRLGTRGTLVPGLALITASLLVFHRAPVHAGYLSDLLAVMVLMGVGAGLAFPALMTAAMSVATPEESGLASGLVNTSMQVGGALGLAVLATLSSSHTAALQKAHHAYGYALTGGLHLALAIGAGVVAVSIALALVLLRNPSEAPAAVVHPLPEAAVETTYSRAA